MKLEEITSSTPVDVHVYQMVEVGYVLRIIAPGWTAAEVGEGLSDGTLTSPDDHSLADREIKTLDDEVVAHLVSAQLGDAEETYNFEVG